MDDRFLDSMREEPRPEFARDLHRRLRAQGPARAEGVAGWLTGALRVRTAAGLATALAVALVVAAFTIPAVRASAQAFLDLFRVRNFAAITVDPARFEQLKSRNLDLQAILGDKVETPSEEPRPRVVGSLGEAAALAGFQPKVPADLRGMKADTISVVDGRRISFQVRADRLQQVLEQLDIRDVRVPEGLAGQTVTIQTTPVVAQRFANQRRKVELIEAKSPEVSLPAGTDLQRLGEIGLRIAGLDAGEARRFARSIDWHGTMIVPVPLNASSFTEVTVRGARGLLVTYHVKPKADRPGHEGDVLLWGENGMVYALMGNVPGAPLVEMAESLR